MPISDDVKQLLREYVAALTRKDTTARLNEVVHVRKLTRVALATGGWADVEPGEYLIVDVGHDKAGGEVTTLQSKDGTTLAVVSKTTRDLTAIGEEIWSS